jgi:FtsP/CotA-like multicopper oxidase with cupredoxin domain
MHALNGWTLPWRMNNGVKEFHLVAEPVLREMAPGFTAHLWGYNGQSPGPTIEVVEGDKVRCSSPTGCPSARASTGTASACPTAWTASPASRSPPSKPGKTFVYEFVARRAGTFMYHPHADEMVQMAMGMMGFWVTHPRDAHAIARSIATTCSCSTRTTSPGASVPKTSTMTDFNLWSWNSRAFPGIAPLVARQHERVRIRVGNLTMTNHPIHLHGHEMQVTGTDGGPTTAGSRWPEVTVDIGVGQMKALEFTASAPGDWAFHCHKSHHTMNAMGHGVPTTLGVDTKDLADKISALVPNYMAMDNMADMPMKMPLPENTLPMSGGDGPHGSIDMGGMFTVVKIRPDIAHGDYRDPGWYKAPPGTVAYLWEGAEPPADRGG